MHISCYRPHKLCSCRFRSSCDQQWSQQCRQSLCSVLCILRTIVKAGLLNTNYAPRQTLQRRFLALSALFSVNFPNGLEANNSSPPNLETREPICYRCCKKKIRRRFFDSTFFQIAWDTHTIQRKYACTPYTAQTKVISESKQKKPNPTHPTIQKQKHK